MSDSQIITDDEISIVCIGEPNLWRVSITVYDNNSREQAEQTRQQIIDALDTKKELDEIKKLMKTSEYLYSGEFSNYVDSRLRKLLECKT